MIERVSRGHYRITTAGQQWLAAHPSGFATSREADLFFKPFWDTASSSATASAVETAETRSALGSLTVKSGLDPLEQIENGIASIQDEVAQSLLMRLRSSDPEFFEEAVVKVLLAMGYGGAEQRGQRIGGTGDGGVDGVIDQDALGLDQIYIQAKRYADGNTVGRETIQAFAGALQWRGSSRGVFITSSDFSRGAVEFARQVQARIILLNGERLADLMIKYRVGVQVKQSYEVMEVDEDFFE